MTQLSDRLKSLHGEMSEKGEESMDWGEVDTKLMSLIGEGVEQFVQQTGQNMDMSPDTSVPESMGDLTEEHKALFQGIKRLIYARRNMTAASQCNRTQQGLDDEVRDSSAGGHSDAPDQEESGDEDEASAVKNSADETESATEKSDTEDMQDAKKPKTAETESASVQGSV
ncbi:hypothetical protein JCM24511_08010 [Saitozyma sp. JCM 24511]|nr:hypothetical protein JCM24511_08010 [Saitozyma sp. JCM 24511]